MNKLIVFFLAFIFISPVWALETDFLVDNYLPKNVAKPEANLDYDYTSTRRIPIELKISSPIKTRDNNLYEGQPIEFKVRKNVYHKNRLILKKDTIVTARIETIVSSGMNGIPYYIYLGNFNFPNLENSKLSINYFKSGQNRTYFVLPLKWALTFLPPTGSLTNFIMGGHAKITERDIITAYYYPNWK